MGLGGRRQHVPLPSDGLDHLRVVRVIAELHQRHIRVVVTSLINEVTSQLSHYGITGPRGPDAYYDTPGEALEAFHAGDQGPAAKAAP